MSLITPDKPVSSGPSWPQLRQLGLDASEVAVRRRGIGGSDANVILSSDAERIRTLWLEKRGKLAPVDLSTKLPVMLGCWTEPFNRQWFELVTLPR